MPHTQRFHPASRHYKDVRRDVPYLPRREPRTRADRARTSTLPSAFPAAQPYHSSEPPLVPASRHSAQAFPANHLAPALTQSAMPIASSTLRRSRSNRMIAGVVAGLADYFNTDVTIARVIFVIVSVISAGFPGTLVYLLLWLIIPEED